MELDLLHILACAIGDRLGMSLEIIDADGHVTETWEQIARHLDEPYRKRSLLTPFFPQDGWDRRLTGGFHDWAGDVTSWHQALDAGGMAMSVLFPTPGGPVKPTMLALPVFG